MNKEIQLSSELKDIGTALTKPLPRNLVPVSGEQAKEEAITQAHLRVKRSPSLDVHIPDK